MKPSWLPDLVLFKNYGGDWPRYLDALYEFFKKDFIESSSTFEGRRLGLKRHPLSQGKEATFWHMITEGADESTRQPDMLRCERIRWPRPIIEHPSHRAVKMWKNVRGTETRICLWLESLEYLVVLADRKGYLLPWTAYVTDKPHTKRKLKKEFEEFWKKKRP